MRTHGTLFASDWQRLAQRSGNDPKGLLRYLKVDPISDNYGTLKTMLAWLALRIGFLISAGDHQGAWHTSLAPPGLDPLWVLYQVSP